MVLTCSNHCKQQNRLVRAAIPYAVPESGCNAPLVSQSVYKEQKNEMLKQRRSPSCIDALQQVQVKTTQTPLWPPGGPITTESSEGKSLFTFLNSRSSHQPDYHDRNSSLGSSPSRHNAPFICTHDAPQSTTKYSRNIVKKRTLRAEDNVQTAPTFPCSLMHFHIPMSLNHSLQHTKIMLIRSFFPPKLSSQTA